MRDLKNVCIINTPPMKFDIQHHKDPQVLLL
jgi:hypothetical protein